MAASIYEKFKRALYETKTESAPGTTRILSSGLAINVLLPDVDKWDWNVGNVTLGANLKLTKFLGEGGYGRVYKGLARAKNTDLDSAEWINVAVKLSREIQELESAELAETMAHQWLSGNDQCSPAMLCLYAVFVTKVDKAQKGWNYGLILPLMDGDLFGLAERYEQTVMTPEKRYIKLMYVTLAMVYDLVYMHSNGWAHNDVKPENYLYKWDNDTKMPVIKISDFGLACTKFWEGPSENRAKINEFLANFKKMTNNKNKAIYPYEPANEKCSHMTTTFYQMPSWDGLKDVQSETKDITENFANDAYCIVMSVKDMFPNFGFERDMVTAPYKALGVAYAGRKQRQMDAWGVPKPTKAAFRDATVPYEFLNAKMKQIGYRFSNTLYHMSDRGMTATEALGFIAEQVSDALKLRI